MKYPKMEWGKMEAVVNKLGGEEAVEDFLSNKLIIVPNPKVKWIKRNGVIFISVTSNGRKGKNWIKYFKKKGIKNGYFVDKILLLDDFKPTTGKNYNVAILAGGLFSKHSCTTEKIENEAKNQKMVKPNTEVACLIRDMFTDREIQAMGLRGIVVMHEPVKDSANNPYQLHVNNEGRGDGLNAYTGTSEGVGKWSNSDGFVFVVPEK